MQAKSGKKQSLVKPVDPDAALDADEADPGKVAKLKAEQAGTGKGKYGRQPVKPFRAEAREPGEDRETSWIEIEMLDEADRPVPGVKYEIELPDGSVASGVLDGDGLARIDGIEPGNCRVTFPELDKDAWEPA